MTPQANVQPSAHGFNCCYIFPSSGTRFHESQTTTQRVVSPHFDSENFEGVHCGGQVRPSCAHPLIFLLSTCNIQQLFEFIKFGRLNESLFVPPP